MTKSAADRIRAFRAERIAAILADETPVFLSQRARVVLHLLPLAALDVTGAIDLTEVAKAGLAPLYGGITDSRYNLDGYLSYREPSDGVFSSYVQFFRNGAVEATDAIMLGVPDSGGPWIPCAALERSLIDAMGQYLALYRMLGVSPPAFGMVSLLNVKGYKLATEKAFEWDQPTVDRSDVLVPELLIEDFKLSVGRIVRPVFDAVWNAGGYEKCPHYNDEGEWSLPS